jgi:phosphatidylglycerophosphate synthase
MKTNTGSLDRALRALVGLLLIALVFVGPKTPWGWLGLILVGTSLMGWCPAYAILGVDTCEKTTAK